MISSFSKIVQGVSILMLCGASLSVLAVDKPVVAVTTSGVTGNIANGDKVFATECSDCHSVKLGKNKKGPSVFALFGKSAAQVADANYSAALKASGIVWTADKLDNYISNPRAYVVGGKMKYDGLADAKQRQDVIAYMASLK